VVLLLLPLPVINYLNHRQLTWVFHPFISTTRPVSLSVDDDAYLCRLVLP